MEGALVMQLKVKKLKLDKEKIFNISDEELLITHNKIIDIRNNFVAHRGDNENEIQLYMLKFHEEKFK